MPNTVTIASVYWCPLEAQRSYRQAGAPTRGYMSRWKLDAVAKAGDAPSVTRVAPCYQWVYTENGRWREEMVLARTSDGSQFNPSGNPEFDSAIEVARDLINEWSRSVGGSPGLTICAGDEPTKEEIEQIIRKQRPAAMLAIAQAERYWLNGQRVHVTSTDYYRNAAKWLGKENYEWVYGEATDMVMKACPFCGKATSSLHPVCQNCDRVHDPALMRKIESDLPRINAEIAELTEALDDEEVDLDLEDDTEKKTQLTAP